MTIQLNLANNVDLFKVECEVKFQNNFAIDRSLRGTSCICAFQLNLLHTTQWSPTIFLNKKCLRNILCENAIIFDSCRFLKKS